MRIQTNVAANTAYRNLSVTNGMLQKSVQRLSSGFRINRSGDDVAGLAIANELRNEGRGLAAAQRNATQAAAVLDIADGSLGQISQIIDRMRELATVAGSANSSDADRQNLDSEFQALLQEIDRIADETTYQGQSLFGFNGDFRVGTGTGAVINVSISGLTANDLTLSGLDILSAGAATAVLSAITTSGGALDVIADVSGEIGAAQNRLEYAAATLAVRIENVAAAESVIRDLDVAQETTRFTKFQILQQAGTAMLAQANSTPQAVLSLLRG